MMKTARKGSDSNTNCITQRHLRKYVHLRLQLTLKGTIASIDDSLHNLYYQLFIYNRKAMHSELANP